VAGRRGDVLAEPAVEVDPQQFERAAGVDVPEQAGRATVAGDDRIDDDPIAGLELLYIFANLLDDAAKLVAQDGWVLDPAVELTAVDVEVGATDAGVAGRNQHLARPDARVGCIAQADVSIVVQDSGFHIATPSNVKGSEAAAYLRLNDIQIHTPAEVRGVQDPAAIPAPGGVAVAGLHVPRGLVVAQHFELRLLA